MTYRFSLFIFFNTLFTPVYGNLDNLPPALEWIELTKTDSIKSSYSQITILELEKLIEDSFTNKDSLGAIKYLNKLGSVYTNRIDYQNSYESYWKALLLAQKLGHLKSQTQSLIGLGILYSLYDRRDEALSYYQKSLNLSKELLSHGQIDSLYLVKNFYILAVHHRYDHQIEKAESYLDSCTLFRNTAIETDMVKAERGYLTSLKGEFQDAENILLSLEKKITESTPTYLVFFYSLLGEMYLDWENDILAEKYFIKSIQQAQIHLSHLNFLPTNYNHLANIYTRKKDYKKANQLLKTAHELDTWLYSSLSPNNKYMLEIKDQIRIAEAKRQALLKEQKIQHLEYEDQLWFMRLIILLIILISAIAGTIHWGFNLKKIHGVRQNELEEKRKLEVAKNQEILAVKNKELTNTTLQIIAKDELLHQVKTQLKTVQKKDAKPEIRQIINSIKVNKDMSWLEFENRFTAVNSDFYTKLQERYPNLNPYDLKICALIKLNFTAKEMAKLLGISPESANTARYRLRKRLGISKEINLTTFINSI
ncbi:tetratricopeptide repeat protein [Sediminitomix flava]|uniref:Tetratricopeptide repeat protein n=1 Tax=Sediminitomix flava TaxID=379075 RepID=A0A315Z9H6_SEDFL|nr:tetratricopeptide repeat protein [Sediminitomix flava]PWJ41849.1 tetratricopeptide repeat protein [Sediminitomix flava]